MKLEAEPSDFFSKSVAEIGKQAGVGSQCKHSYVNSALRWNQRNQVIFFHAGSQCISCHSGND